MQQRTQTASSSSGSAGATIAGERTSDHGGPGPRLMTASTLAGDKVVNHAGATLGKLSEIMIEVPTGAIAYGVLATGGLFGIGEKLFAVPWSALTLDTERECFVLDCDEDRLRNAPGFDSGHWPEAADPMFMREGTSSEAQGRMRAGSTQAPTSSASRSAVSQTGNRDIARRRPTAGAYGPFAAMERMFGEIDRIFDDFGFGSRRGGGGYSASSGLTELWSPQMEVYEDNGRLRICADLPGLRKEDVKVEIDGDMLTISGERRDERSDESGGWRHSERRYGSFHRSVALPEGVDTNAAQASFRDGVLEISLPMPARRENRAQSIEVR